VRAKKLRAIAKRRRSARSMGDGRVNAIDNSAAYSIGTSDGAISGSSHSSIVEQAFI
jgi:hypothetical protein